MNDATKQLHKKVVPECGQHGANNVGRSLALLMEMSDTCEQAIAYTIFFNIRLYAHSGVFTIIGPYDKFNFKESPYDRRHKD